LKDPIYGIVFSRFTISLNNLTANHSFDVKTVPRPQFKRPIIRLPYGHVTR